MDGVVSDENLAAVASRVKEPEVLLGLAFLARTGSPARGNLLAVAIGSRPEYAPIRAVLHTVMDGIDQTSVNALVECDPENALGYYLTGILFHEANQEAEAMEMFRRAATCPEIRLYESTTGEAL
jgi:hypothetical protein